MYAADIKIKGDIYKRSSWGSAYTYIKIEGVLGVFVFKWGVLGVVYLYI